MSELIFYRTSGRHVPFQEWLKKLKNPTAIRLILKRLDRLQVGHWGDMKAVAGEVIELRLHYGPGYRLYCAQEGVDSGYL